MSNEFEFELIFTFPKGAETDPEQLANDIYLAVEDGDPMLGLGDPTGVSVELLMQGDNPLTVILDAAQRIMKALPDGSQLREIKPDLVSLEEVAEKFGTSRQNIRTKPLPRPMSTGHYQAHEICHLVFSEGMWRTSKSLDYDRAKSWLLSASAAHRLNGHLAAGVMDLTRDDIAARIVEIYAGNEEDPLTLPYQSLSAAFEDESETTVKLRHHA